MILGTTFIGVIGFARVGSAVFWKSGADEGGAAPTSASRADMIAPAIALSLLAGAVAGLYPSWRIGRTAPAIYLKTQ